MPVDEEGLARLRREDHVVLLVPGVLSQIFDAFGRYAESVLNEKIRDALRGLPLVGEDMAASLPPLRLPLAEGTAVSFFSQVRHLREQGIAYVHMAEAEGFNTQQGVDHNAGAIAAELERLQDKRVVILSHSKGGLDTLEALRGRPELWERVAGWAALQAPFYGSPVADQIPEALARYVLEALGGDAQSLYDLGQEARNVYMQEHAQDIRALTGAVPVACFYSVYQAQPLHTLGAAMTALSVSVLSPSLLARISGLVTAAAAGRADRLFELLNEEINRVLGDSLRDVGVLDMLNLAISEPNDGLVPRQSTELPFARVTELSPAADHAAPVMDVSPFHNFWDTARRDEWTLEVLSRLAAGAAL